MHFTITVSMRFTLLSNFLFHSLIIFAHLVALLIMFCELFVYNYCVLFPCIIIVFIVCFVFVHCVIVSLLLCFLFVEVVQSIFIEQINTYMYIYQKMKIAHLNPGHFIMVNKVGHDTVQGRQDKSICNK